MSEKDDHQGMINGVKHYSTVAIRGTVATAKMIISTGGDPLKALDVAEQLNIQSMSQLIDAHMRGLNAAGITEHLAKCPPSSSNSVTSQAPSPSPVDYVQDEEYAMLLDEEIDQ